MNAEKHTHWTDLLNAWVEIRCGGRVVRSGFVDNAMPDSSIVWIAAEGSLGREMFSSSEGFEVWVQPQPLTGDCATDE